MLSYSPADTAALKVIDNSVDQTFSQLYSASWESRSVFPRNVHKKHQAISREANRKRGTPWGTADKSSR